MPDYVLNPYTGKLDKVGNNLSLDQTTQQTVINGKPIFDKGIQSNDDVIIKAGKKLILDG